MYTIAGRLELPADYLKYCVSSRQWNPFVFRPKDSKAREAALNTLLASPKWKRPLDKNEREILAWQIR